MIETLEPKNEPERRFGAGRAIIAAWIVAILIILASAGVEALASRRGVSQRHAHLIGAMIPRHDPSCALPISAGCGSAGNAYEDPEAIGSVPW